MKGPVDHIARTVLPWRDAAGLTECGLAAASYPTITREAYRARLAEMGEQRCALFTCMTCSDVVRHWKTWAEDPVSAIQRETGHYYSGYSAARQEKYEEFRRELVAIAALIGAHREEFDGYIAGLGAVVRLDEERKNRPAKERKARAEGWDKKW